MKEIRIAVQAEDRTNFIKALDKVKEKIQEGCGSVPIFYSNGKYKFRYVIIEDAEQSESFDNDRLEN